MVSDDRQTNLIDGTDTIFLSLSYTGEGEVAYYEVTTSGAGGLPPWLHLDRETGDMFGKPPLDETTVRLSLKAQLEDGRGFERRRLFEVAAVALRRALQSVLEVDVFDVSLDFVQFRERAALVGLCRRAGRKRQRRQQSY